MAGTVNKRGGFTLLEMSIVIVIIGLIIGGLIVSKSLIRAARVQTAIADVDRYKKAIALFKDKYKEMPGDMPNATSYWGTDPGGCPTPAANATPKTATCNGDGNGIIGNSSDTPLGGSSRYYEGYRFWQHLANAGMIEGSFNGALSSNTNGQDIGLNVPFNKLIGSTFTMLYAAPTTGAAGYFGSTYGHVFEYGTVQSGGAVPSYGPTLTTVEALSIDQKIDDGMPGLGNVLSFTTALAATPSCATGTTSTATYSTGTTGIQCSLIFLTGY